MDRNIQTCEVVGIRHFPKLQEEAQHHSKENHSRIHQYNFTNFPILQHEFLILTKFIITQNIQDKIGSNNGFAKVFCEVVDWESTAFLCTIAISSIRSKIRSITDSFSRIALEMIISVTRHQTVLKQRIIDHIYRFCHCACGI